MKVGVAIVVVVLCVVFPGEAYAWGLVTHIQIGRTLLEQGRDLLATVAPCILEFPSAYLYGSIAPDRFLAKNLKQYREHTHNWDRAFSMLRHSGTDDLKAFSLGYLSHLAADVVAHNLFVPLKIIGKPGARGRRHTYWELKFEHYQPPEAWELADAVPREADQPLFDSFMELFQVPSLFSFSTNMMVTDNVFRVLGSHATRKMMSRFESRSERGMAKDEVTHYMDLCQQSVAGVLSDREESSVTDTDPRGGSRITNARLLSKAVASVRRKRFTRKLSMADGKEISELLGDAAAMMPEQDAGTARGAVLHPYRALHLPDGEPPGLAMSATFAAGTRVKPEKKLK